MNPSLAFIRFVKFADSTIKFEIDSQRLIEAVDVHFAHCLGEEEDLVSEYQVSAGDEAGIFSIQCDGEDFQSNITFEQVLFQLMQDGLIKLNGASSTHLVFHSAGLAYQERGLLLCGKSGSGKSTLAAWLTANGFQYLSDEVVAVPLAGGDVRGFCRSLVLKRGSSAVWKRWLDGADTNGYLRMDDGTVWISPTSLNHPSAVRESIVPHVILFPTYTADVEFKTERLTAAATLFQLLQCLVNARNFEDYGMAIAKELAQKVSAYRLTYSNIEQASEWIQKTLTT